MQVVAAWLTVNVRPAIVIVPVRGRDSVLALTLYLTVAVPEPLGPEKIVIHESLDTACQRQPAAAVTSIVPLPPMLAMDADVGEIVASHDEAPACDTVNACPATVTVPVRGDDELFASTLNATVPLPVPDAPAVTVTHVTLLVAVHSQPVSAVTATEPVPPAEGTDWLVGVIAYVHGTDASASTTCAIESLAPSSSVAVSVTV